MNILFKFLNRTSRVLLELDPDGKEKLLELEGKVLRLEITLPPITLFLVPANGELEILQNYAAEADVTLTGSAMAFAKLGMVGSGSGVVSDGQVNMRGDTETGQAFQQRLSQLDIDWEELLSRYIGDTPARKAGNAARGLSRWAIESLDLSRQNTAEYFQEEKQVLVTGLAMERFEQSVDEIRADVDRLAQRIVRLKQRLTPA